MAEKTNKYVYINGLSNTKDDTLGVVFLADDLPLARRNDGSIGFDKQDLLLQSIDNGDWIGTPLTEHHEDMTNDFATVYGEQLFTFKIPFGFDGFITANGNLQYTVDEQDTGNEPRYGVYKLNAKGVEKFKELRDKGLPIQGSTYYKWDGNDISRSRTLNGTKIISKITPISNTLIYPDSKHPSERPAIKTQANNLSVNSDDTQNNTILLDNKKNEFDLNSSNSMEDKKKEIISADSSVNGTTLPYPIRPTVRILLDAINILPEEKITAIKRFVDNGCVCNATNNSEEQVQEVVKETTTNEANACKNGNDVDLPKTEDNKQSELEAKVDVLTNSLQELTSSVKALLDKLNVSNVSENSDEKVKEEVKEVKEEVKKEDEDKKKKEENASVNSIAGRRSIDGYCF